MATIRLTRAMRRDIKQRVLEHRFNGPEQLLKTRQRKLGEVVYNDLYDAATRRAMAALPEGFLPTATKIEVNVDGDDIDVEWGESRPVAAIHAYNYAANAPRYEKSHPLSANLRELERESAALEDLRRKVAKEVSAVLNSASTLNKLLTTWPEVEPFTRHLQNLGPTGNVPAPLLATLNRELGLGGK